MQEDPKRGPIHNNVLADGQKYRPRWWRLHVKHHHHEWDGEVPAPPHVAQWAAATTVRQDNLSVHMFRGGFAVWT